MSAFAPSSFLPFSLLQATLLTKHRHLVTVRPARSDYDSISQYYDTVRGFGPEYYRGWVDHMFRHGELEGRHRLLDVGCGTGRYTTRIQERLGRPVVGVDLSTGMLAKARGKVDGGVDIRLVCGDAQQLPFKDASFDAAILILVVHHIEDLAAMASELHRVLDPGGRVMFMTRDHDEIEASYIAMFPGVLEIDLARFPKVAHLESVLEESGFSAVGHTREANPGFTMTREDVLAKVDGRFISTLTLMSDQEFCDARAVFSRRLEDRYGDEPISTATFTFVHGDA
jgi:ubiquinone/menaquinone biosynthesis C-methylase UbiE